MIQLPNFIIPGAPKAGTTSVVEYLNQHPDVYIPKIKEPRFFISDVIENLPKEDKMRDFLVEYSTLSIEDYNSIYEVPQAYKAVGDASVQYMYYYKETIPLIKSTLGDPKIIIFLREPVERAFSNFLYQKIYGQDESFEKEIEKEPAKIDKGLNSFHLYFKQSLYYDSVKAFMDSFTNVKIFLLDDFKENPLYVMSEIFSFLGVDSSFTPNLKKVHNISGVPKNSFLKKVLFEDNIVKNVSAKLVKNVFGSTLKHRLVMNIKSKSLVKNEETTIDPEYKVELSKRFADDIEKLSGLINRDLSHWL